jgi:hypothetical protein
VVTIKKVKWKYFHCTKTAVNYFYYVTGIFPLLVRWDIRYKTQVIKKGGGSKTLFPLERRLRDIAVLYARAPRCRPPVFLLLALSRLK